MKITITHGTVGLILFSLAPSALAQTITAPAEGIRLQAGDDFATRVLADPWDMSSPDDISPNRNDHGPGWRSIVGLNCFNAIEGMWFGTTESDAYVTVYSPGLDSPAIPIGRNGRLVPIPTATYRKLVFKARTSVAGETMGVHWYFSNISEGGAFVGQPTVNGWRVYSIDLGVPESHAFGTDWLSRTTARGFRIDPNESNTPGMDFALDWVRLTRADSDPSAVKTTISWASGSGADDMIVDIIDNSGDTVESVAAGRRAAGDDVVWFYGGLPGGAYTVRVYHAASGPESAATRSVRINQTPTIKITSPDETGADDYATLVRYNRWDFRDSADVTRTANIHNISFTSGRCCGGARVTPVDEMNGTTDAASGDTGDLKSGYSKMRAGQ